MKAQAAGIALRAITLISPLALVACGGGGGDTPGVCNSPNPAICAVVGGTSPRSEVVGTLFTTAPSRVTLNVGTSVTYGVGGGSPPYSATSGNTNVVTASISGTTLSLKGVAANQSSGVINPVPVAVLDSRGQEVGIGLTVVAQAKASNSLSVTPEEITVSNCTTNIPFIFTGGVKPYTIFSSDNFNVPVSSPLPLDPSTGSFYFTASTQYPNSTSILSPSRRETLTVLDGLSRTATVTIDAATTGVCPRNPILKVIPESANFRGSEIRSFQITGGPVVPAGRPVPLPVVTFDLAVAKVLRVTPTSIEIQAAEVFTLPQTALMTVTTSDEQRTSVQRTSVVITVFPQP